MAPAPRTPNFLYIGPDKAGSTWLHRALSWHPDVFMYPGKDVYFFDRYYERGWDWYLRHFAGATTESVVGEISHDYLYSRDACERIRADLPDVRLMVCLRNPIDRAESAFRYLVTHGLVRGTFEEALTEHPELTAHGQYAQWLEPYLRAFPRGRIHIAVFDDLVADARAFASDVFRFLGVSTLQISDDIAAGALPAAVARWPALARVVKRSAIGIRNLGGGSLVGAVKQLHWVRSVLYRAPHGDELAGIRPDARAYLASVFRSDVQRLDAAIGASLAKRWRIE